MAKHLSMLENNEVGMEARRYFIEIEKKYRTQPQLIDGKDPRAIIRGLKSQLTQHQKKNELLESNIKTLIEENSTLMLPPPPVDVEPYKQEIQRLNNKVNELHDLKEHFEHMAGVQIFKTSTMFGIVPKLIELQANFLNNPKIYTMIGDYIRECRIVEKDTEINMSNYKEVVKSVS